MVKPRSPDTESTHLRSPPRSPKRSSPAKRSSPRNISPKRRYFLISSKSSSMLSILGILIFFSFITNVCFWKRGNSNDVSNERYTRIDTDSPSVWAHTPTQHDDTDRTTKRRDGEKKYSDRIQQVIDKHYPKQDNILDNTGNRSKIKSDSNWLLKREPLKLPLPSSATDKPIKLNQMVVILDGINDNMMTTKEPNNRGVTIIHWLVDMAWSKSKSLRSADNNPDSEDLSITSQTAVWENDELCVPLSDWQTAVHPSCNSIHEMDISSLLHDNAFSLVSSKGHWRSAWKVDMQIAEANGSLLQHSITTTSSTKKVRSKQSKAYKDTNDDGAAVDKFAVLKSLKYIHDPNVEVFELNKVDGISLDVLTSSKFTINIYGFCGSSSIQEYAGGDLKGLLPKLDPIDKLHTAIYLADGIADIHAVGTNNSTNDKRSGSESNITATLIHNDINMDNVLLGHRNGTMVPIFNDFNIAVFQKKNSETGEPCQFKGRFANPQWMSPEQQSTREDNLSTKSLNEKIDIYALGNILFKIAVGNSPWKFDYDTKKITPELREKIARAKLRGAKPKVPPEIRNSTDPSIKAIINAMNKCYRNDADLRPSAREVANYLQTELDSIEHEKIETAAELNIKPV